MNGKCFRDSYFCFSSDLQYDVSHEHLKHVICVEVQTQFYLSCQQKHYLRVLDRSGSAADQVGFRCCLHQAHRRAFKSSPTVALC